MGLIAREIEARGIATLSMSSALSITAAANPPRAVYLDYPLGHTSGKPLDRANQQAILADTLKAFEALDVPGQIKHLDYVWHPDDSWKEHVMRPQPASASDGDAADHEDDRVARLDTPQYQTSDDEHAATTTSSCPTCVFLEDTAARQD